MLKIVIGRKSKACWGSAVLARHETRPAITWAGHRPVASACSNMEMKFCNAPSGSACRSCKDTPSIPPDVVLRLCWIQYARALTSMAGQVNGWPRSLSRANCKMEFQRPGETSRWRSHIFFHVSRNMVNNSSSVPMQLICETVEPTSMCSTLLTQSASMSACMMSSWAPAQNTGFLRSKATGLSKTISKVSGWTCSTRACWGFSKTLIPLFWKVFKSWKIKLGFWSRRCLAYVREAWCNSFSKARKAITIDS